MEHTQSLHCLQCVEEVVRLSKLEQHTCLSRVSWTGPPFAMVWRCYSETSTVQYIIYNIKRTVRKLVSSSEKTNHAEGDLESPLPLPLPPKKKNPQPTQKRLPIKTFSSPMRWPRCRFPDKSPSTNQLHGPHRRFVPGTNNRPRVCAVKNSYLKHSCHHTGNNDQVFPTPNTTRRVSQQWDWTTRSPDPVRGSTSPSTPHSPHWREEDYPKVESPEDISFFLFFNSKNFKDPFFRRYLIS